MARLNGTAFEVRGREDAPLIVLIHGLGLCRKLWGESVEMLAEDFRVLTYDLPGHGDSAPSDEVHSLDLYARQILELMDHLAVQHAHLVGFSIGGMINRRFALDYPKRLASLVILNSPHDRGAEAQAAVEARAKASAAQGSLATMDAAIERWFTLGAQDSAAAQSVRDWRSQVDDSSYAQAAWVLASGVVELIAPEPPITAPTLVMTSRNDVGSTPKMSADIAAEIAGSELRIVLELKHLGLMEDVKAFMKPVRAFLNAR